MTDTVKLIIEIPADVYRTVHKHKSCILTTKQDDQEILIGVRKGILLDDVKAEIIDKAIKDKDGEGFIFLGRLLRIFDNIGKESEANHEQTAEDEKA